MSNIVRAEIERLVELVNDQSNEILAYPDVIPLIELDLLKESLRRLYQHVNYLSSSYDMQNLYLANTDEVATKTEAEVPKVEEENHDETDAQAEALMDEAAAQFETKSAIPEAHQEQDASIIVEAQKEEAKIQETANVEATLTDLLAEVELAAKQSAEETKKKAEVEIEPIEEKIVAEEPTTHVKEEAVAEEVQEILIEEKSETILQENSPETANTPAAETPILNETKKEEVLIADQIGRSTISSLKTAIGINDKFQFINELFDGSMPKYNAFIKKMDAFEDRGSAFGEIYSMKQQHNWQEDNNAFVMLQDYINRRF